MLSFKIRLFVFCFVFWPYDHSPLSNDHLVFCFVSWLCGVVSVHFASPWSMQWLSILPFHEAMLNWQWLEGSVWCDFAEQLLGEQNKHPKTSVITKSRSDNVPAILKHPLAQGWKKKLICQAFTKFHREMASRPSVTHTHTSLLTSYTHIHTHTHTHTHHTHTHTHTHTHSLQIGYFWKVPCLLAYSLHSGKGTAKDTEQGLTDSQVAQLCCCRKNGTKFCPLLFLEIVYFVDY